MAETDQKLYRNAYVVQNTGHDFQELLKDCERILFISTGYEPENELLETLQTGLKEYDPVQDLIVPVGNVAQNLLVGMLLSGLCRPDSPITLGVYYAKSYHFRLVNLTGVIPTIISGALTNGKD